jgi:hypothetical protein
LIPAQTKGIATAMMPFPIWEMTFAEIRVSQRPLICSGEFASSGEMSIQPEVASIRILHGGANRISGRNC